MSRNRKLLITACPTGSDYLLMALMEQNRMVAAHIFCPDSHSRIGAVYLGKVKKIVKNLNACFVEIANREQCFMHMDKDRFLPFLTNRAYDGRILEGDELLVQLEQEAVKTKQAAVTARITLQGEYFVFTVGDTRVGISKKLEDSQRDAVRQLLAQWRVTDQTGMLIQEDGVPPFGLVVRTQAGQLLDPEGGETEKSILYQEYEQLRRQFTILFLQGRHRTCYSCLHEAGSALVEALKLFPPTEYEEAVTDLVPVHTELLRLQEQKRFSLGEKQIRLYQDHSYPLGSLYCLETKLEEALGKTVWLKSGANLVIEQTESLTAIDVNTGKCIRPSGGRALNAPSSEDIARRVNLEAAEEIVRQLRLRNLSGIIIVDFINLTTLAQEEELLQRLRTLVKTDPVTVRVVDITPLGLVEITRRKVYPSLREQIGRVRKQKD